MTEFIIEKSTVFRDRDFGLGMFDENDMRAEVHEGRVLHSPPPDATHYDIEILRGFVARVDSRMREIESRDAAERIE